MFSRRNNNNGEEARLMSVGGNNDHYDHTNNNLETITNYTGTSSIIQHPTSPQNNNNNNPDNELMGIVYCCAQPTSFAGAPTFEWSSLDMNTSRVSCRKVVQRIFARIDTTSFGERRSYDNDLGNVHLLSIIGVDKCIFVVGCMKRDFIETSNNNNSSTSYGGGSVMVEMDRLLVSMQRSFAQYVARAVGVGRHPNNNNNNQDSGKNKKKGNDDDDDQEQECKIDQDSLNHFDDAVQHAIDDATNRISEIIYHAAAASNAAAAMNNNNSMGPRQTGLNLMRRFLPSSASNGLGGGNSQQQSHGPSNYGYQHHESVAATYLSGGTGADDFGGLGSNTRQSFIFNLRKSQYRDGGGDGNEEDEFDRVDNENWCCPACCTTRVKIVLCFTVVFIVATVIFVLLFACERKGTNDFQFHC